MDTDVDLGEPAPAEDSSEAYRTLPERFTSIVAQQPYTRARSAPGSWHARAAEVARPIDPSRLCVDAPSRTLFAARVAAALDDAYAQAGDAGAELVLDALPRLAAICGSGCLTHGTGSWALEGILGDGQLTPGGDGMTGEVALSGIAQPDVFVCLATSALALYAAATFAHTNAGWTGGELAVSAVRTGRVPVAAFVGVLLFAQGDPVLSPEWLEMARNLIRFRTLEMDKALLAAYDDVLRRAASGDLPGDGRQYSRRLGTPDDHELSVNNVLAAVVARMGADPEIMKVAARERLRAGTLRYAPVLRDSLMCALPGEAAPVVERKRVVLAALRRQYPVVLAIRPEGVEVRTDPGYAWSDERLVRHAIPLSAVSHVFAPLDRHPELRPKLAPAIELCPLEDLEVLRLVAEGVAGNA